MWVRKVLGGSHGFWSRTPGEGDGGLDYVLGIGVAGLVLAKDHGAVELVV